jgi:hypothetical protein
MGAEYQSEGCGSNIERAQSGTPCSAEQKVPDRLNFEPVPQAIPLNAPGVNTSQERLQRPPKQNNGDADATDIALCMELITFGGFGTPLALLLLDGPGFFPGRSWICGDFGSRITHRAVHADLAPTREPNSCIRLG